jgi:hypothetical protein
MKLTKIVISISKYKNNKINDEFVYLQKSNRFVKRQSLWLKSIGAVRVKPRYRGVDNDKKKRIKNEKNIWIYNWFYPKLIKKQLVEAQDMPKLVNEQ